MVALRAWRRSFASESFENNPNDEALHARLLSDTLPIGASSKGKEEGARSPGASPPPFARASYEPPTSRFLPCARSALVVLTVVVAVVVPLLVKVAARVVQVAIVVVVPPGAGVAVVVVGLAPHDLVAVPVPVAPGPVLVGGTAVGAIMVATIAMC